MVKALHEAKVNSSWIEPNEAWDNAVRDFVERILRPDSSNRFLPAFEPFAACIAEAGAINALAQTVLKCTCPGVPDTYQGTETWDLSLVDPDNRRPVDYEWRRTQLDSLSSPAAPADLVETWRDGRIKLFVLRTLLRFRREHRRLFEEGAYTPVQAGGTFAECCVAFERRAGNETLLVVVPRFSSRVGFPAVGTRWQETMLAPASVDGTWTDLFTGRTLDAAPELRLAELLADFPVAALVRQR
jgi:(1->4)-alpha-D-glucan 1-alpha-D-glucosylmutase